MKLSDIKQILSGNVLTTDCDLNTEVYSAFSSDMMSNVLAYANNKSILLTGLNNPQVLRTAEMMGMACVILIGRREPDAQTIALAEELGICLMTTKFSMFTTCGKLYTAGLRGGEPVEQ